MKDQRISESTVPSRHWWPDGLRTVARDCGQSADRLVQAKRYTQSDKDGIVYLLRRAEKALMIALEEIERTAKEQA